jgi:hypothetical protein
VESGLLRKDRKQVTGGLNQLNAITLEMLSQGLPARHLPHLQINPLYPHPLSFRMHHHAGVHLLHHAVLGQEASYRYGELISDSFTDQ